MLKKIMISLPITLICAYAQAQTAAAVTAKAPAKPAVAAAPAAATSTAAPAAPAANPIKFSMGLEASYTAQANVQTAKDGSKSRSETMSYAFSPAMAFGDGYRLSSYLQYDQVLTDSSSSDNGWIDPSFTLSRKAWDLSKYLRLSPSGTIVIPTKEGTRDIVDLQTAVSAKGTLGLNTKNLGLDALSASYAVQYTRFFTDFATTATGNPVTQHRTRQDISLGYQIIDPLSASLFFRYESRFSSEGIVRNSFILSQTVEYSITDSMAVSVGHANSGDVLRKEENYRNGIAFDSPENSEYSLGLSLSL